MASSSLHLLQKTLQVNNLHKCVKTAFSSSYRPVWLGWHYWYKKTLTD